jgi:aspartyl-tRNA(Asn)/glutamyl-tRNA(Gln) amidotransferase subunit A
MTTAPQPCFQSVEALASSTREGRLSSVALVEAQVARIARLDDRLHAFVDIYADQALACAHALDQMARAGVTLGPLHGVTVAVKDLFEIEGHPIAAGSAALPPRRSTQTATVVTRLRAAGAIVLGKTHTVEYAFGGWGTNATMGTPWNPWDLATHRVPGGSSSGSAVAVSAGLAAAALGTDTGGSVRIPAGLCGLVGLKTTRGLLSRHGLVTLCPSHDTVGPLTRTVRDAALLLDVMAGADPLDEETRHPPLRPALPGIEGPVEGLRVWALPAVEGEGCDAAVLASYDRCLQELEGLGMHIVERALPQRLDESMRLAGALMSAEGYANLGTLFEQDLRFDPHVRRRVLAGRNRSAAGYLELQRQRAQAQAEMRQAMDGVDLCCFPTNAISAIPVAEVDEDATPLSRLGRFANWLDLCSVAVPAGLSPEGLPVSVQFVGRPWDEPLALRAARAYERATRTMPALPPGLE